MLTFQDFLAEGVGSTALATNKIFRMIERKVKKPISLLGIKKWKNPSGYGWGARFSFDDDKYLRLNWAQELGKNAKVTAVLDSIDYLTDTKRLNIKFDRDISLIQTVPFIIDVLKYPNKWLKPGEYTFTHKDLKESVEMKITITRHPPEKLSDDEV